MKAIEQIRMLGGMPTSWPYYQMPFRLTGRMEVISFKADPEIVAAMIPAPLTPDPIGQCALTSLRGTSEHWGAFNETFVSLACELHGVSGFYCLIVFLDDPRALCAGRETLGVPKALGAIRSSCTLDDWEGRDVEWVTEYEGQEIIRSQTTGYVDIGVDELPSLLLPLWCLRVIPNPSGQVAADALRQLIALEDDDEVIEGCAKASRIGEVSFGRANVRAGTTGGIDLTSLQPRETGEAYRFSLSCLDGMGRVVHDYLNER